jgi:5-formyltetrahydrofolate cyclo-ligase
MSPDIAPPSGRLAGAALHDAKRALRERMVADRDALAPAARDQASAAICDRILALPSFAGARRPLLTLPFRSEWNTRALLEAALARGSEVLLPRVDEATRMLDLFVVEDIDRDTAPGYCGIPEPRQSLARRTIRDIDFVLVPGVAFDARGHRLGYGGGYYDRLLVLLRQGVPKVAGAYDCQIADAIPHAPHDLAVDTIVTPSRVIEAIA